MEESEDRVEKSFSNCLNFGDIDEILEKLDPGRVEHRYVSWDEFGTGEQGAYDLRAVMNAGASLLAEAEEQGISSFILPYDGTGCHVFLCECEEILVRELLRVGAMMESAMSRRSQELRVVADPWGRGLANSRRDGK